MHRRILYVICNLLVIAQAVRQIDREIKLATFSLPEHDLVTESFKDNGMKRIYNFGNKFVASIKSETSSAKDKLQELQKKLGSKFSVENNLVFHIDQIDTSCNTDEYDSPVSWHLNRINQREKLNFYNSSFQYQYSSHDNGAGVDIYVLDTGIYLNHTEFDDIKPRFGFVVQDILEYDGTESDLNGHGTHVSALINGITYGVAKDAQLISVKSFDRNGVGSGEEILQGLEYIYYQTMNNKNTMNSIINLSFTALGDSSAIEAAVGALYGNKVVMVSAAGMCIFLTNKSFLQKFYSYEYLNQNKQT